MLIIIFVHVWAAMANDKKERKRYEYKNYTKKIESVEEKGQREQRIVVGSRREERKREPGKNLR